MPSATDMLEFSILSASIALPGKPTVRTYYAPDAGAAEEQFCARNNLACIAYAYIKHGSHGRADFDKNRASWNNFFQHKSGC